MNLQLFFENDLAVHDGHVHVEVEDVLGIDLEEIAINNGNSASFPALSEPLTSPSKLARAH